MEQAETLHLLHRRALWTGGWHMFGLLAASIYLVQVWPAETVLQWLLPASVVLIFINLHLRRHLGQNHSPSSMELYPALGAANVITLARGWGISCIAGWMFLPNSVISDGSVWAAWAPGLLYVGIGCLDYVDGLFARLTSTESVLGQSLDVEMDALGLMTASALAVSMGRLPMLYLLVGASYYIFRLGIRHRHKSGKIVLPLKDRPMARIMAGLNMGFVAAALLPLYAAKVLSLMAVCFAVPLLIGFVWDWLVVTARLTDAASYRLQRVLTPAAGITALLMRLILLACGPALFRTLFQTLPVMPALVMVFLWALMVLGCLGRTAALGAACWLAYAASPGDAATVFPVALSAALVIVVLGSGRWSWWKPEDAFLSRKAGTQSTRLT